MSESISVGRLEKGMYRNRALLDAAAKCDQCMHCGRWAPGQIVAAHSNLGEHGKGKGLKAHDCFFAFLCDLCHGWLDNRNGLGKDPTGVYESTPADRKEMFLKAMARTWLWLWREGRLKVVK